MPKVLKVRHTEHGIGMKYGLRFKPVGKCFSKITAGNPNGLILSLICPWRILQTVPYSYSANAFPSATIALKPTLMRDIFGRLLWMLR
jgi:hypothetical protein